MSDTYQQRQRRLGTDGGIFMRLHPISRFAYRQGLAEAVEAAGITIINRGGVWCASDPEVARSIAARYSPLAWLKSNGYGTGRLDLLRDAATARMSPLALLDGGSNAVTAEQIGAFLAGVATHYRTLKAAIETARDEGELAAVDIDNGWPDWP